MDYAAITQFQAFVEYIALDTPINAERVAINILQELERLRVQPGKHTPDKYKTNNDGNYRAFELHKLRVAYYAGEKEIRILRIRHTRQEPKMY